MVDPRYDIWKSSDDIWIGRISAPILFKSEEEAKEHMKEILNMIEDYIVNFMEEP